MVEKIRELCTGPVEGAGYELVDVEWKREPVGWVCRLLVDKPEGQGRIGIEDCERLSREVGVVLEVSEAIPQAYNLEVSSPGLDRPLRTSSHFRRFIGERAKVKLVNGIDGRRNFTGTIVSVTPEGESPAHVVLDVDGAQFSLPLDDLEKATMVFDFAKAGIGSK
jgi:ribosome maturation factor RimP